MTSLFTTATMRSMTTGPRACCAGAAAASIASAAASATAAARAAPFRSVTRIGCCILRAPRARIGTVIAADIAPDRLHRIGADPRHSVQFQLHEIRHLRFLRGGHEAMGDQAQHPAIAIVFRADQAFERAMVEERVVPARQRGPSPSQRPLRGNIALLQDVPRLAIAQIEHLPLPRQAAGADSEFLHRGRMGWWLWA